MGYEIKMLVGKRCLERDEIERDRKHPFKDGSGFPYKKNKAGEYIKTGRKEWWFQIMAMVDLCKLGYQDDPLNDLIAKVHAKATENSKTEVVYCYDIDDGNRQFTEDKYGQPLGATPIKPVLEAMQSLKSNYRRLVWAIGLLTEMAKDPEDLEVVFYGY